MDINVGVIISFDGAVCGFLLVYIIPIYMHFKCYYWKTDVNDALISEKTCVDHPSKTLLNFPTRVALYSLFVAVGIFNLIIFFYDFFS